MWFEFGLEAKGLLKLTQKEKENFPTDKVKAYFTVTFKRLPEDMSATYSSII